MKSNIQVFKSSNVMCTSKEFLPKVQKYAIMDCFLLTFVNIANASQNNNNKCIDFNYSSFQLTLFPGVAFYYDTTDRNKRSGIGSS